jgi:hypothetical protein
VTKTAILNEIRRRADAGVNGRFAHPVSDSDLALANADGLESAGAESAMFVITDAGTDRDGDRVNPQGINFDNWRRAGAPVFFGHQEKNPYPIGSCIHPRTGELCVYPEMDRVRAEVWFDMSDPQARFIAGKVKRGLLRACSVAFVPLSASRRGESEKGQVYSNRPVQAPLGWDFHEVDMSELSIVGVGSNPNALLQMASDKSCPASLCKSLRQMARRSPPPRVKNHVDYLQEIRDSYADTDRFFADFPRRRWLYRELDHITANLVRGFDKALGSFSGSQGGYVGNQQADVESARDGSTVFDRYGKIGRKCLHCGKAAKPGWKYCIGCGKAFESDMAGPTDPTGEAALVDAGQVPPDTVEHAKGIDDGVCPECSEPVKDHWKICPACEARLPVRTDSGNVVSHEMESDPDKEEILQRYGPETGNDEHDDDAMRQRYRLPQLP